MNSLITMWDLKIDSMIRFIFIKNKGLGGKPARFKVANKIIFDLKNELGKEVLNGETETKKEILKVSI
ncbi:MAG TPA: hypothetical protein DDE71_03445 [Tenacibaculum sp.]|nr:hypothetical protein [Tenacibaculum sp.]